MSRIIEAPPNVVGELKTLMKIGYTLETSIADIIDNSIAAKAKKIGKVQATSRVSCNNGIAARQTIVVGSSTSWDWTRCTYRHPTHVAPCRCVFSVSHSPTPCHH